MNASADPRLKRIRRLLPAGAAFGAALAAPLAFLSPAAVPAACRFAVFACLAPALGSLLFALIHRITGGQWGDALAPWISAGSRLAPWIWLLALPLLFLSARQAPAWPGYGSLGMLAIRGAAYAAVLFALATALASRPAAAGGPLGPAGLIVLVFTLHLLAEDWLCALDPGWPSTAFPLVWMTGLSVSGLACAILAAVAHGMSPGAESERSRAPGLDWGSLLLAATLFWCYVSFAQFLIVWAGNLPREISWFERRARGGWALVPPLLAGIHFLLPLAVLLSRPFKRSAPMLGGAAATLLVAQLLYAAWLILPASPGSGPLGILLDAALAFAGASLCAHRYLAEARRRLESR